jgi:hypothetical protein
MGVQAVLFQTAMQSSVRPEVLARVAAIDLVGSEGGQPVGYALTGPLAAAVGVHAFLTASATVMAVAGSHSPSCPRCEPKRGDSRVPRCASAWWCVRLGASRPTRAR